METYFCDFANFKQNDWARFLPIAGFTYNNAKNTSTGHILFELNCSYYFWMSYKEEIDPRCKSKLVDKLLVELRKLIIICRKNLYYTQKFQKCAYNKGVKSRRYASGNKVWFNIKYIKTKQNKKLKAKFFRPF